MREAIRRGWLRLDAAARLGARPVLLILWHRSPVGQALAAWRLRRPAANDDGIGGDPGAIQAAAPGGATRDRRPRSPARCRSRGLPTRTGAGGVAAARRSPTDGHDAPIAGLGTDGHGSRATPAMSAAHAASVRAAAHGVGTPDWHAPFAADGPALAIDTAAAGDIRLVWERNRWAELPLLAQAARLDPGGGHAARLAALLADWDAANPAFRGPNWACGQEASLRALHLALALELLGGAVPGSARAVFGRHGQRIAATPAYALAQDNNHPVSEAAGLLVCGLLAGEAGWVRAGQARLEAALARLVAPCGAFAQVSTGYHRLLLDVVAVAEWLRLRHGAPPLGAIARERMEAATRWLHRLTEPTTGATPRLGHQDGSCFADLSRAGPDDARGSVERAARLFGGRSAGWADDPGCRWLGLAAPGEAFPVLPARWAGDGVALWREGRASALLRTGPLRFRPGQADLLHFDLWDGAANVLRDGGTGAYNPPAAHAWWHKHFSGTAAHNTVAFDDRDQMPRAGRFLFARWPATGRLPDGAWVRDHAGCRHARTVAVAGRRWVVTDAFGGRFAAATLRWRLCPGDWLANGSGVSGPAGRIDVMSDAPVAVRLETGWESPAYGVVVPCPVLVARAAAPLAKLVTTVNLA